ncbi:MAG: hypothetical protein C0417_09160 [Chlorobiaceae bacterium]|nr:hypothetical protein [Chlorobiaceae bacterium]
MKYFFTIAIFLIVSLSFSLAQIPTDGLVAWYPFNGSANDESGNNNNGTLIGGITPTTDRFGNANGAFLYDGSTGYIKVPNSSSLQSPTTAITLSGWVLINRFPGLVNVIGLINKSTTENYGQYFLSYQNWNGPYAGSVLNQNGSGYGFYLAQPLDFQKWHFIASTWDGDTGRIFVDGIKIGSSPFSGTISPDTNSLLLGLQTPGWAVNYLDGKLDDICIYNRALSESEIKALYDEGGWDPNLIAYYPFNGSANDESGNDNNGTIIGEVSLTTDRFDNANGAFLFDGSTGYVHVPNSSTLQSPTTAITLSGWVYLNGLDNIWGPACIVNKSTSSSYGQYILHYHTWEGPYIGMTLNGGTMGTGIHFDNPFNYQSWYFVAATWDGYTAKNFVNGIEISSIPLTGIITPDTNALLLGLNTPGSYVNFLDGKLDDIRIYNRALSENEIHALYHEGGWDKSPKFITIKDIPNDQGGKVKLYWESTFLDTNIYRLPYYSIWRSIPEGSVGKNSIVPMSSVTKDFKGSAKRITSVNGTNYAWEWIANQPAHRFNEYSYTATTLYDSMSTTNGKHYFLVSAHTNDPNVFYDSEIESGYSVDNLAPMSPVNLIGSFASGSTSLRWSPNHETDLRQYVIYRGSSPANLEWLTTVKDTNFTDSTPLSGNSYYGIRAQDIHDNLSPMSNMILTGANDGIDLPISYTLSQNYPNPFNPSTVIMYGLPQSAHVTLSVFNTLGQRVALLVDEKQEAGYHEVTFDGAGLTSGVYFYRIQAGDPSTSSGQVYTETKKLLLMK